MPVELRKRKAPAAPPAPTPAPKKKTAAKVAKPKANSKAAAKKADVKAEKPAKEEEKKEKEEKEKAAESTDEAPAEEAKEEKEEQKKPAGKVAVGDTIDLEGFGGEVETNDGEKTSLKDLVEKSGSGVVIFTYPKASTPGCKYFEGSFLCYDAHLTFHSHKLTLPHPPLIFSTYTERIGYGIILTVNFPAH